MSTGSLKATRGCYSNLMPQYFAEILLRVYTKKAEFIEIVQAGYRAILKDLEDQNGLFKLIESDPDQADLSETSNGLSSMSPGPTPPVTESPSTPKRGSKTHSRNASFTMKGNEGRDPSYSTPFSNNEFMSRLTSLSRKSRNGTETESGVFRITRNNVSPTPVGSKRRREMEHSLESAKRRK